MAARHLPGRHDAVVNDYPAFSRDRRPALVELGGAVLIVGGAAQLLLRTAALAQGVALPIVPIALGFGIDTLAIVTGLLVRAGIAWIVCVNVVAVLAFIDFRELALGGSLPAALFLGLDSVALVAVVRHRAWFERERPDRRSSRRTARAAAGWTVDEPGEDARHGADPRPGRG